MKIRIDFVTNSSSSSFVLARKSRLSDRQKKALLEFIEGKFLGEEVLSPESSEEEIQKLFEEDWEFEDEDRQKEVRDALAAGKSIYSGDVDFECAGEYYAEIFESVWRIMEKNSDGDFITIDGDLSY